MSKNSIIQVQSKGDRKSWINIPAALERTYLQCGYTVRTVDADAGEPSTIELTQKGSASPCP